MPDANDYKISPEQEHLHAILEKVVGYQHSLPGGRAVELEELKCEGVLSPDDLAFLTAHSVVYKPHNVSDFHAMDMFQMPTDDGGCVFIGPSGPPLTKRSARLGVFGPIVDSFLKLPRPPEELLLHIKFTEQDGMAMAPGMIFFTLDSADWRQRLPAIRKVAAEYGLEPWQDEEVQGRWSLSFRITPDTARTVAATVALLGRGCGFTDESEITYSAGALDAALGRSWTSRLDQVRKRRWGIHISFECPVLFRCCIFGAAAIIGTLAACWIGSEIYYARSIAPKDVRTVADHFHRFGEPRHVLQLQHDGATYYELSGATHTFPLLVFPSSPPAYIYDDSGIFVDWCSDPGDQPAFRARWQMTNTQQVEVATFRKKYER